MHKAVVREPETFTATELEKVGVELISAPHLWLRCTACGSEWVSDQDGDGNLPSGYWKCPNGCDVNKKLASLKG
jgi:hypothetical protein